MLISVVVPAYNCINSLEATLDSILLSGLTDYELLLVDDGSKDGTSSFCDELQRRHDRVRCVHQENGGVSRARNRGIQEARGEYILFFDADDTVDPDSLCGCEKILLQHPDMLIFGMSFDYYFHGKLYRRDEMVTPLDGLQPKARWIPEMEALFSCNALSPVWNKFIRRDLLEKNKIRFPGGMIEMEDFLFSVRCMKYCETIYFLPEAIYRYRQPESESNTYRRLCRIPSLSAYMEPFEAELAKIPGAAGIVEKIYESFFYEMVRFAGISLLQQTAKDMLQSRYASVVESRNPVLFDCLKKEQYHRIWIRSALMRLRHWLAVRVKYIKSR